MSDVVPFHDLAIGMAFTLTTPGPDSALWVKYDSRSAVQLEGGMQMIVAPDLRVYRVAVAVIGPPFDAEPRVRRTANQSVRTNRLLRQLLASQRAMHRTLRQYLGVDGDGE